MKLAGATERLTGAGAGATLAGMVHEHDGGAEAALELAQEGKDGSNFAAGVLVHAMQAHEGIEDKQAGAQGGEGVDESQSVVFEVESEGDSGDHVDVEAGEVHVGRVADAFDAPTDDVQGVLGGEEQDGPLVSDRKTAEARGSGGNGNSHVQGQE